MKSETGNKIYVLASRFLKCVVWIFYIPIREIVYGLISKKIPWKHCLGAGLFFGMCILLEIDYYLVCKLQLGFLYPHGLLYRIWSIGVLFLGFIFWGYVSAERKKNIANELKKAFYEAGLRNSLGKYPNIVFDKPISEFYRRLRLTRECLAPDQFKKAKAVIESALNIHIEEIVNNQTSGTIDLIYGDGTELTLFDPDDFSELPKLSFYVGKSRTSVVMASFKDIPHFLLGGQSGGGKSTFMRQLITGVYLINDSIEMSLMDLKGGAEFGIFENLPRVRVMTTVDESSRALEKLSEAMESRLEVLKLNQCQDIDSFYKISENERKYSDNWSKSNQMTRHLVVIDEAYALFRAGAGADAKAVQLARASANVIAQKGRAVGIHIIIATQRPDKNAVDPQTKANLVGRLSFAMSDIPSSTVILDNAKAASLPKIPGRAIWQVGLDEKEIQTPYLTVEKANELLAPYRKDKSQKTSNDESKVDRSLVPSNDVDVLEKNIIKENQTDEGYKI